MWQQQLKSFVVLILIGWMPVGAYELSGDLIQGGLVQGKTLAGAKVYLDGTLIRVSDNGYFVFGFGRDAQTKTVLRVELPTAEVQQDILAIKTREYDIQRIDGLEESKVTVPPEVLPRIRQEGQAIAAVRMYDHPRLDFLAGFRWPAKGIVTGVYGSQRVLNGKPRRPHYGIDIAVPAGTPVVAPAPGIVSLAYPDMYFSGQTLVLDHGHGVSSTFLHLDTFLVEEGDEVDAGQKIATVGSSGRSTGAHLDWRVNWFDRRLDPQLLVGEMPR